MYIHEWEKDEESFTITRATKRVTSLIEKNNVVVVTGSSGSGKSSIIHHVALQLHKKKGYDVIPFITCPADIIQYRNMKKNQVFVVDDICGKSFINEQGLQYWREQAGDIDRLFSSSKFVNNDLNNPFNDAKHGQMKVLVTCRLHIFKDEKFKSLKMFTNHSIDLQSNEYSLLMNERKTMIKKYIRISDFEFEKLKEIVDKYPYFPLLCKMSQGKTVNELTELFSSPVESIKNDIKVMIESKNFEYCALVLCVCFTTGFNEENFNPRTTLQNVKNKITEIVSNFKINLEIEMERQQLSDTFKRMTGTFVKKTGSVYSIAHDKLYDMIAVTCGIQLQELFIEYAPTSFIAERFRFKSIFPNEEGLYIYLSKDMETLYFKRIFRDLQDHNGKSFFHNRQLNNEIYKDKLMQYLKRNREFCKHIFNKLDRKGMKTSQEKDQISTGPLTEASKIGFYDLVSYLISIKCNINKRESCKRFCLPIVSRQIKIQDNEPPLYAACEHGHINVTKLLIEKNADLSQCGRIGPPLFVACENNHTDIVKILLDCNADVSQCGKHGDPPLYTACERGYIEIAKLLLANNADMSQCGRFGPPLYVACENCHTNVVALLLDSNADVSQRGRSGDPPLYVACGHGSIESVKLLLNSNANVAQCGRYGDPPLYVACSKGFFEIVELLLQRNANVQQCGESGPPLYVACKHGHTDIVKLLLHRNADVSQSGVQGTPLYVACEGNHINIVELLLERNADVSDSGRYGPPLYVACMRGCIGIVKLLLNRDADVSQCGIWGPPLHVACERGLTDIVDLLLENNADVSQSVGFGRSPLYIACLLGHTEIVKLLLQRNANLSQCGIWGPPLNIACEGGRFDIVKLLLEKKADLSQSGVSGPPLYVACKLGYSDIVKLLLKNNANVLQCGKLGPPLYIACLNGFTGIVKLLLQRNADISQCGLNGSSLYNACRGGHVYIVKMLLERNADVNQCGRSGDTPLFVACVYSHIEIVKLLLDRNADLSRCDRNGDTPLHVASFCGHTDIVKLLLERKANVFLRNKWGETPIDVGNECIKNMINSFTHE